MIIVGHRGARNLWPENSLTGFRNIVQTGVEAVEFDVHPTRDDKLAVIHDPTLERTTLGTGKVTYHSLYELAETKLRDSDDYVPSLDQVLDILVPAGMELHIELKTDADAKPYDELEDMVMALVERRGIAQHSILTCFAPEVLERIRKRWPDIRLLGSLNRAWSDKFGGIDAALDRFAAIPHCLLAVEKSLLLAEYDTCLKRIGAEMLGVWVPNEPADIAHWIDKPIRQMTTDRPDLALAARKKIGVN
ncbi:MAG: glycerophosphodiester phosphodiesterase family protein [Rhodospirillales bacterium]